MSSRSGVALQEYRVQRIIRVSFISTLICVTSGAKQSVRETVHSALGCEKNTFVVSKRCSFSLLCSLY